jgi:hypothetical protein
MDLDDYLEENEIEEFEDNENNDMSDLYQDYEEGGVDEHENNGDDN